MALIFEEQNHKIENKSDILKVKYTFKLTH